MQQSKTEGKRIDSVLPALHWLSFTLQFNEDLAEQAYKAPNGQAPSHITDVHHWLSATGSLRSETNRRQVNVFILQSLLKSLETFFFSKMCPLAVR